MPLLEKYNSLKTKGILHPDPKQQEVIALLSELAHALEEAPKDRRFKFFPRLFFHPSHEYVRGLYVYGGVGRGKTMLMDLFFSSLKRTDKKRMHFHAFMFDVHQRLKAKRDEGRVDDFLPKVAQDIAAETKILCFDEFDVTDIADAMILGRLFTSLFDAGVSVVLTSNRPPEDLYKDGLQRDSFIPFIKLLQEKVEVMHLDSPTDYRMESLQDGDVFFHPLCPETDAKMDDLFDRLSQGPESKGAQVLKVQGRELQVETAANGVARFSFPQLCERPLGAADYLAICQQFHTVFIDHVPRMNYDARNEAKRFITLIDTLYDTGRKLVMSAAFLPDTLYVGNDYAFEFQRTISRLIEMQGREYWEQKD